MSNLFDKPRNIAGLIALGGGITIFTILRLMVIPQSEMSVGFALLFSLGITVVIFFTALGLIKYFIYNRIKMLYDKVIGSGVKREKEESFGLLLGKDPIEDVNNNVEEWLDEQQSEIAFLKKQEEFRREFVGDVAHELKTPIFSIQGYVHTLLDGGLEDESINRKYLLRTARGIDRMINIVEDLDSITKLEAGDVQIAFNKFNLSNLIREVIEAAEFTASEKGTQLIFDFDENRPTFVLGDREKMSQVLMNLVVNGIKYGKSNGFVKVQVSEMGDTILTEVIDDGVGIEAQYLPRLFDRFYRVDKSRSRQVGGSGLGLSIVKHILEAHNQKITVRSTPGKGSTFVFSMKKFNS